ncbi:hypothetical protein PF011_g10245 [Phytophthora fragariae]|uniref:Uncharacterized protein n=1 Tax=Phytophthora fragariae TaxID=53985 RepID=A0A6A3KPM6_9STRA|nr:hypothetical protein PF011_g10245 [Phytophthora fragariae]
MISAFEINQAALLFRELDRKCNSAAQPQTSWNAAAVNSDSRYRSSSLVQSATWKTHVNPNAKDTSAGAGIIVSPLRASAAVTARKSETSAGLLFQLEYRALVGYIEAAIPMLYAVYLSILVHMPSAQYYPNTRSITSDQLQTNVLSILTYAATEILSLMWLHVVVKRKLGFSLLHQLSYVLETETELLQGRLFVWIVLLLQLPLVHFGMDFSFRFEWLA